MSKTIVFAITFFLLSAHVCFAAGIGGGGNMPWDAPLQTISADLSGPVAGFISLIAIVCVFGVLIFGGELNHFARTLCFIIMCGATLVAGNAFWTSLGIAGAEVGSRAGYDVYGFIAAVILTP